MLPEGLLYNRPVLLLKLTLVPLFLLAVSLVDRRWGPRVAGRLAGMPVVAGPVLAFIAIEQGRSFGAQAAVGALSSIPGVVWFVAVYAHTALRHRWPRALVLALLAWAVQSWLVLQGPAGLAWAGGTALLALAVGPRLVPQVQAPVAVRRSGPADLALRMVAGALITLTATLAAPHLGSRLGGLMAAFPLLSTVVAAATHHRQGGPYVAALLRSMLSGLYALAAFCVALSLALQAWSVGPSLAVALLACLATQAVTGRLARPRTAPGLLQPGDRP
jgi:uncharacterized membrane protein (GlpM family)